MISDLLNYGKLYFNTVEELYKYFGTRAVDYDAAEVFLYICNYKNAFGRYPKKRSVSDNLCISYDRVQRAEAHLRELGYMEDGMKDRSGLRVTLKNADVDTASHIYGIVGLMKSWYSNPLRYQFLNLLHATIYVADLKTPYNSRRQLVRCMCCGFDNCRVSRATLYMIKQDLRDNTYLIEAAFNTDKYTEDLKNLQQYQKNMHQELYQFNEARKILIVASAHPDYWIHKPSQFTDYTWNTIRDLCERRVLKEYGYHYAAASLYRDLVYSTAGCLNIMRDRLHRVEYKPATYRTVTSLRNAA